MNKLIPKSHPKLSELEASHLLRVGGHGEK